MKVKKILAVLFEYSPDLHKTYGLQEALPIFSGLSKPRLWPRGVWQMDCGVKRKGDLLRQLYHEAEGMNGWVRSTITSTAVH
jgi:hypothetical protein